MLMVQSAVLSNYKCCWVYTGLTLVNLLFRVKLPAYNWPGPGAKWELPLTVLALYAVWC